jgi:hypothetical protein
LFKCVEQSTLRCRRYADTGISNFEAQLDFIRSLSGGADPHGNAALIREFEGVAHQIDEHLAEAERVAGKRLRRQCGNKIEQKFEPFSVAFCSIRPTRFPMTLPS